MEKIKRKKFLTYSGASRNRKVSRKKTIISRFKRKKDSDRKRKKMVDRKKDTLEV